MTSSSPARQTAVPAVCLFVAAAFLTASCGGPATEPEQKQAAQPAPATPATPETPQAEPMPETPDPATPAKSTTTTPGDAVAAEDGQKNTPTPTPVPEPEPPPAQKPKPSPEEKPASPATADQLADTGKGIRRSWNLADGEKIYLPVESLHDDHILFETDEETPHRVEAQELVEEDRWFLKYWSDPSKRRALRKFSEIGSVGCDAQGAISLGLSQSGCTDNDLQLVESLPEVVSIYLFETPVSDEGLRVLAGLQHLNYLYLSETDVKGPGFKYLSSLTELETFEYSPDPGPGHAPEFGQFLKHLTGPNKKLKTLNLWFCELDEGGLQPIGELTSLEQLSLVGTEYPSGEVKHLAGLKQLQELDLGDGEVVDADMAHLAGMTRLRVLNADNGRLTKAGTEQIGKFVKLEKLGLPGGLQDADIAPLKTLTQLKSLSLYGDDLTDACLAYLSDMHGMEELSLPQNITASGLKHLAGMKQLKSLTFNGENVTMSEAMQLVVDQQGRSVVEALQIILRPDIVNDEGQVSWLSLDHRPPPDRATLKYLAQLTDLEGLSLGKETSDAWLEDLAALTSLESLAFQGSRPDDRPIRLTTAGLKHLTGCQGLTSLYFTDCDFGENAFAAIADQPKLKSLQFSDCQIPSGNFEAIGKISTLTGISMHSVEMSNDDLRHFAGLEQLEYLAVPDSVTVEGLAHLASLKNLRSLQLDWSQAEFSELFTLMTEKFGRSRADALDMFLDALRDRTDGIAHLRWPNELPTRDADLAIIVEVAPGLQLLSLPDSITDAGLAHVAQLTKLTSLNLSGPQITDQGLASLRGLEDLESIQLRCELLTDAAIPHLAALKSLNSVYLYGTQITDDGMEQLQKQLPDASIRK